MYFTGIGMKKRININIDEDTHIRVRRRIGERSLSAIINEILRHWLTKDKTREAIKHLEEKGYKVTKE